MPYRVRDEIEVSVYIDGIEFPLSKVNSLNFFHTAESTKQYLPTFHLAILDVTKAMRNSPLHDAASIKVVVAHSGINTVYEYILANWVKHPSGGEDLYELDGFLDAPRYRTGTSSIGIQNTASGALQEIATACGLAYSGIQTNDAQIWTPRNRAYCEFAEYIADHGFLTSTSHLVMTVDLAKNLRYRDVRASGVSLQATYNYSAEGKAHALEFRPLTSGGVDNDLSGYRDTRIAQSIFTSAAYDSLAFTPKSKLNLNTEIRDSIKRGNYTYSPINFGNVHSDYEKAEYQNARFNALLSVGGEFLFMQPTLVHPLDFVFLSTKESGTGESDGTYVLAHKVIQIKGNTYCEKLIGYKEGL